MRSHYNAKFEKQKIGLTQYRQGGILKEYFVITADIIDSRNYDLSDIDKKISILNSKFDKDLMTYFDRSRGDEIQSIIKNAGAIPDNKIYSYDVLSNKISIWNWLWQCQHTERHKKYIFMDYGWRCFLQGQKSNGFSEVKEKFDDIHMLFFRQ